MLQVLASTFEENLNKENFIGENGPARYTEETAKCKAREVAQRLFLDGSRPFIVVGCDTIVDLDGKILEKPSTKAHASSMLKMLSGREHFVHSGVSIFTSFGGIEEPAISFIETTRVHFGTLSDAEIENYVESGEPMDKAGSYGIQGLGGQFVDRIDGCYFNVMGLPMRRLSVALASVN
jgi:septum formation protein